MQYIPRGDAAQTSFSGIGYRVDDGLHHVKPVRVVLLIGD